MEAGLVQLKEQAAAMILEASSLTDELTDGEAQPLTTWALSQGEAAAEALWSLGELASLSAREARGTLAEEVALVRSVMREINGLAGRRRDLSPAEMYTELEALRGLAEELPVPPGGTMTHSALAELAAWHRRLDTRTFVGAIIYLLRPAPSEDAQVE